jgi:hypothetical protein
MVWPATVALAAAWAGHHGILVGHLLQERRKRLAAALTQHFRCCWFAHNLPSCLACRFSLRWRRPFSGPGDWMPEHL